jgi:hypothetical protein
MIADEIVVKEFWSNGSNKHAKVLSSKTIYPDMFKLVMKESDQEHQMFKFFKDLNKAELEAKNYVAG